MKFDPARLLGIALWLHWVGRKDEADKLMRSVVRNVVKE